MYAPGNQNMAGMILASGINNATQSIDDGIEQMMQRSRQLKAMRAMAVDGLGMPADKVGSMGVDELMGRMQGAAMRTSRQGQMMEQALQASEIQKNNMATQLQGYRQRSYQKFTQMMQEATKANPQAPLTAQAIEKMGILSGMDPQDFRQIAGGGYLGARAGHYEEDAAASPDAGTFIEDPVTGQRFLTRGRETLNSGSNPAVAGTGAQEVQDEGGNVIGHTIRVGNKSIFRPLKPQANGQLLPVKDPSGKVLDGFGMDADGKVHDFRDQLQKTTGGGDASGGTKAAQGTQDSPLPMPASRDGTVMGNWYATPRGLMQWDGDKFQAAAMFKQ